MVLVSYVTGVVSKCRAVFQVRKIYYAKYMYMYYTNDSLSSYTVGIRRQSYQWQDVCLEIVTPLQPLLREAAAEAEAEVEDGTLLLVPHDVMVKRWFCLSVARRGNI